MHIPRTRRGFTLIELLVVVAIISLLISIGVPGMARARITARRAKCMGQLQQIGNGTQMYLGEYHDVFPYCAQKPTDEPAVAAGSDPPRPVYPPMYHYDAIGHFLKRSHQDPQPVSALTEQEYLDYVKNGEHLEVFCCPADRGDMKTGSTERFYDLEGTSYEWNPEMSGHKVLYKDRTALIQFKEEEIWTVRDFDLFHGGEKAPDSLCVLYADLHVATE
jgi:prepilin-type N-terminal cleavage/methylation domain-containing protein